ncbi:hypothetical protein ACFL0H_14245, partial [Thermodesulfobacteriota bacterium]
MNSLRNHKIIKPKPLSALFYLALFFCLLTSACFAPKTAKGIDWPEGVYIYGDQTVQLEANERLDFYVHTVLKNYHPQVSYKELKIGYPYDESIFPQDIAAPTFEWIENETGIINWLLMVNFNDRHKPLYVLCGKPLWTAEEETWELIKQNSVQGPAQIVILGVSGSSQPEVISMAKFSISTSRDKVDAPIMFRRVPPSFSYAAKHPETMSWCLADISSYEEPPVVMSNQSVCGSCHTFSQDGRFIGMDMDYKKDKGAYFFTSVQENISLTDDDFINWNAPEHNRS